VKTAQMDGTLDCEPSELFEDIVGVVLDGFGAAYDVLQDEEGSVEFHTHDPLDVN
jgi:hypothetical protein